MKRCHFLVDGSWDTENLYRPTTLLEIIEMRAIFLILEWFDLLLFGTCSLRLRLSSWTLNVSVSMALVNLHRKRKQQFKNATSSPHTSDEIGSQMTAETKLKGVIIANGKQ